MESKVGFGQTPRVRADPLSCSRGRGIWLVAGAGIDVHTLTDPVAVELLEQLDDAVYEAVTGACAGSERVGQLWKELAAHISPQVAAALREQYLQYALMLYQAKQDGDPRQPQRAIGALDVLSVLFKVE